MVRKLWPFLLIVPGILAGKEKVVWREAPLDPGLPLSSGVIYRFQAPLSNHQKAQARTFGNSKVSYAECALTVPPGFDPGKSWRVIILNTTADLHASNLVSMQDYLEPANLAGCVVLAADGPVKPERDSIYWRWAMKNACLDFLHNLWPVSVDWPLIPSGYSGGAKMAAQYAAMLMGRKLYVAGVYMGGCNEDFASTNRRRAKKQKDAFLAVPMFLCSGEVDLIATPDQVRRVADRMKRTGFLHVRIASHPGGHQFNAGTFLEALAWFDSVGGE